MRNVTLVFVLFFCLQIGTAQDIQIGIIGGATLFQGDYPSYRFKDTLTILAKPGFGLFIRKPINDQLSFKGSLYFTTFAGDDRLDPKLIGLRSPSSIKYPASEMLITAEYAPVHFELSGKPIDIYALGGFGFSKTTFKNSVVDDSCPIVNLVVPIGAGIRARISELLTLSIHAEFVQGLNDCLDGLKSSTANKDVYTSLKIGLSYGLSTEGGTKNGRSIGCPTF